MMETQLSNMADDKLFTSMIMNKDVNESILVNKYYLVLSQLQNTNSTVDEEDMVNILQELLNNVLSISSKTNFEPFFSMTLPIFLKYLNCGPKNYIREHNKSQIRLTILKLLFYYPQKVLLDFLPQTLAVIYDIIEHDNEDNAFIVFKLLVDLHRKHKLQDHAKELFQLIIRFIETLIQNTPKLFELCKSEESNILDCFEEWVDKIFTELMFHKPDINQIFHLLPRGCNSLKLFSEFPFCLYTITQIYRPIVEQEMFDLVKLAVKLMQIRPTENLSQLLEDHRYISFLTVQCKFFSYVALMVRSNEDKIVAMNIETIPSLLLLIFKDLPSNLTQLRKEILQATRYFFCSKLRYIFLPYLHEFLDEDVLIGNGWANRELRPLICSIFGDLFYNHRDMINLSNVYKAISFFSRILFQMINSNSKVLSVRSLTNCSECLNKIFEKNNKDKECYTAMLTLHCKIFEIFAEKIFFLSKNCIENLKEKEELAAKKNNEINGIMENSDNANNTSNFDNLSFLDSEDNLRLDIPDNPNYSMFDYRNLFKILLNGLKFEAIKINDLTMRYEGFLIQFDMQEDLKLGLNSPHYIEILIKLFKKIIKLLIMYNSEKFPILSKQFSTRSSSFQHPNARSREEKEMMDTFSGIFIGLKLQTFRIVAKANIDYLIQEILQNPSLNFVVHFFLNNKYTSPTFSDILTNYLVNNMEVMGNNAEMSTMFVKLFKSVFNSVSIIQDFNEPILQSYLKKLVSNSMEFAMVAPEPYNYFMLLRSLFRSIGGGTHDLLYREFLPLLPPLLQGLNNFQTGIHRKNMKDLFVELCLTIPVRLSTLLPYLPWLMDPLVSALNGSPNLISQGLRTLELCVDNLQPDFLHAHFELIRFDLMQSLWRNLHYQNETIAKTSFRILGKLGGANHRMINEPQKLEYIELNDQIDENIDNQKTKIHSHGCCSYMDIKFDEFDSIIHLPVDKVIEAAYRGIRMSTTSTYYRQHCWQVIQGFLIANIQNFSMPEDKKILHKILSHSSFTTGTEFGYCSSNSLSFSATFSNLHFYKFPDEKMRKVHELALTGMIMASAIKELNKSVVDFMIPLVRHYTMVAICQQSGPISGYTNKLHGMDPLVLIDAMIAVMAQEEKELCKPCHFLLRTIIETSSSLLGDIERACQLPLYSYILERVCALCYERAWYSKYGGCLTVRYLFERMSRQWVLSHQFVIFKAMMFVMNDLSSDLSSGVIEMVKDNLESIIRVSGTLPEDAPKELVDLQKKSINDIVQDLLRQITSNNASVRTYSMYLLEEFAKVSGCSLSEVIWPHKEFLEDMVPFKKHRLLHQPPMIQIGILEGNTFLITLEPPIFNIDLNIREHKLFIDDLISICNKEDSFLMKYTKSAELITPLRKAGLRALSACHFLLGVRNNIFGIIFNTLTSGDIELLDCAYDCLSKYKYMDKISHDLVLELSTNICQFILKPNLTTTKNIAYIKRLKYLAQLFPYLFKKNLCDHMIAHLLQIKNNCFGILKEYRDNENDLRNRSRQQHQQQQQIDISNDLMELQQSLNEISKQLTFGVEIIYILCEISAATSEYISKLLTILIQTEHSIDVYAYNVYFKPIKKFFQRYPQEAIVEMEKYLNEDSIYRFYLYLLDDNDCDIFRAIVYENPAKIIEMLKMATSSLIQKQNSLSIININNQQTLHQVPVATSTVDIQLSPNVLPVTTATNVSDIDPAIIRYKAIKMIYILIKHNNDWLPAQHEIAKYLKTIWISDSYFIEYEKNLFKNNQSINEPRLLVKCLLNYLNNNKMEIDIYFQLLKVYVHKYCCHFKFLRDFFANIIINEYSIEWKRKVFLRFVELYEMESSILANIDCSLFWTQELKSKILQFLIIPIFKNAFETKQNKELLGSPEDDRNLINVFIDDILLNNNLTTTLQIFVMKLGSLIIEHSYDYIDNKNKDVKTRLMTRYVFCFLDHTKHNDAIKRAYGYYYMCQMISKVPINKTILVKIFRGLLYTHQQECRNAVFSALKIFISMLPIRLPHGHVKLRFMTKTLLQDECGQATQQFLHLIHIIVKYYSTYYPTRHTYLPYMMIILNRFSSFQNLNMENKKLSLDIIEVIIRWEHMRIEEQNNKCIKMDDVESDDSESSLDFKQEQGQSQRKNQKTIESLSYGPINKEYSDIIILNLIKFICLLHESNTFINPATIDLFGRRTFALLKDIFQNELWPLDDINLSSLDRILISVKDSQPNTTSICLILEFLILILQTVQYDIAVKLLEPLQRGIAICCACTNPKVVPVVHKFLVKLISREMESGQKNFKQLYSDIHSILTNGLNQFKNSQLNSIPMMNASFSSIGPMSGIINRHQIYQQQYALFMQLFSVLMVLKAKCINEPVFIDCLAPTFIPALQKLVEEHIKLSANKIHNDCNISLSADIIMICFEIIQGRFNDFNNDIRRNLINFVFIPLIDKSKEVKIFITIIKMLEEWLKVQKNTNQFKEKSLLIIRIGHNILNRFTEDIELNVQYLELIYYIYTDESFKGSDILQKLEFAFLSGLACLQPNVRQKFFDIMNNDLRARIFDRLMYIITSTNWELFDSCFWIKQCIQMILTLSSVNETISSSNPNAKLPLPISFIPLNDNQEKLLANLVNNNNLDLATSSASSSSLTSDISSNSDLAACDEDVQMVDISRLNGLGHSTAAAGVDGNRKQDENFLDDIFNENDGSKPTIKRKILKIVCSFLDQNRNYKCWSFYNSVAQLCYMDTKLAHHIWIQLFPRIYSILNNRQQNIIATQIVPFLLSGIHLRQRDMQISSINTFFEAVYYCNPPIKIRPFPLRYLGKNYGVWHRASLILESDINTQNRSLSSVGGLITNEGNTNYTGPKSTRGLSLQANGDRANLNCFNELIPDIPASMFLTHPQECMSVLADLYDTFKESDYWAGIWNRRAQYKETLIAIAYEQLGFFEQAKGAYELAMNKGTNDHLHSAVSNFLQDEYMVWEEHWIRCSKELNQWDFIISYGSHPEFSNPIAVLESAWRIPDWNAMQKAVIALENNVPTEFTWKYYLYKGYNALCNPNNRDIILAEKVTDLATNILLKWWRRLPLVVSSAHVVILQGAHQIIELQEAITLHNIFNSGNTDIRSIIKTWKNRLPIISDELSHWCDIFTWRQHHYQAIVNKFEQEDKAQAALSGSHSSAQSLIILAKTARKHFLINVALDRLHRIHTIPKVPLIDCFQKIRQQLKCYLMKHALQPTGEELQEAMDVINSTHLNYFYNEMTAEFIGLKGYILMKMGRLDESYKTLSASLQIADTLVKTWSMWGELSYEKFIKTIQPYENRDINMAKNAMIAFLNASRSQNEIRARKYLPSAIWLLAFDKDCILANTLSQHYHTVPPSNWVPWIHHLLNCLNRPEGESVLSIINYISKFNPETVYFSTRTLYLTLKMEHREMKIKYAMAMGANNQKGNSTIEQVQASAGLWKCSRIMHSQREFNPTLLTSIEGIFDSMTWFRENWCEEILRQLRQSLAKCYNIAFENRDHVAETKISTYILNYFKKLINTFGIGLESTSYNTSSLSTNDLNNQTPNKGSRNSYTTTSESLAMRVQSLFQDQEYQNMKSQFSTDFDFTSQDSQKLSYLIVKIKKWIKLLEGKTKLMPKSWHLEEKCRFLSNFSQQTIEVSLPGEHFLPKLNKMCVIKIARFMPKVEVVNKLNSSPRRLYIRGHNGKIYPYLICNDSSFGESRREEQLLHVFRLLNLHLSKHKETGRRVINYHVPRIVPISTQMRFVEENVSSLSLIDIYKQDVIRRGSDPDAPIGKYYDQLFNHHSKGTKVSLVHLKEIIADIQTTIAPATLIKDWALQTFPSACEYWHFRKIFTLQLGLIGMSEYAFHLCRLNPDMLYIHRDSGLMSVAYFRFELDNKAELISPPIVPFRITNSMQNFITEVGITGPLIASMIASASCFIHPNFKVRPMFLAFFRDEIANWFKNNHKLNYVPINSSNDAGEKDDNSNDDQKLNVQTTFNMNDLPELAGEELTTLVLKAVNTIMSRFQNLANFDGNESYASTLIKNATNPNNLCQMDPAWHPWL